MAGTGHGAPTRPTIRWHLVAVAVAAGAAALAGLGTRATWGARVSGDEPQYLLTATSLAEDRSLDLSDELAVAAYLDYHEVPLDPQSAVLDDGRQVSPHDPLLPLLLALPMAAAGWVGAKATLALVAATTATLTAWLAVRRFGVAPQAASLVTAGAFAGIPLAAYGGQVYPEMPAALVVCVAVAALTAPPAARRWPLMVVPAAVIALPWLSVKYLPVAGVIAAAYLWRIRHRAVASVASVVVLVAAGVAYLALHQRIYGGWTVYAAGDHFAESGELAVAGTRVDPVGRSRRLVGLAIDAGFGIATWSPLWFLLAPAVGRAARRWRGPEGLALGLVTVTWLVASFVALTMHGWWVPGRQLVIALPLATILIAAWVDRSIGRLRLAGAVTTLGAINWLWLAIEASTGRRTLIVDFLDTAAPPYRLLSPLLPDGMRAGPVDEVLLAVWAVLAMTAVAIGAGARPGALAHRGLSRSGAAARRAGDRRPGSLRAGSWLRPPRGAPRPPDR